MVAAAADSAPQVLAPSVGFHNEHLEVARKRLLRGSSYRDARTVMVMATRGMVPAEVAMAWRGLMTPMNQPAVPLVAKGFEVADAYNNIVSAILQHPDLSQWPYMLTVEEDNLPPPDGLLKLLEDINGGPYDAVGGLYWTKGEGGVPQCWGQPMMTPRTYAPWLPAPDSVVECNGLGMGFTLFRLAMFKNQGFEQGKWFRTVQEYDRQAGGRAWTQDLYFFENAARLGYRFACSSRVLVGHMDPASGMVW